MQLHHELTVGQPLTPVSISINIDFCTGLSHPRVHTNSQTTSQRYQQHIQQQPLTHPLHHRLRRRPTPRPSHRLRGLVVQEETEARLLRWESTAAGEGEQELGEEEG